MDMMDVDTLRITEGAKWGARQRKTGEDEDLAMMVTPQLEKGAQV